MSAVDGSDAAGGNTNTTGDGVTDFSPSGTDPGTDPAPGPGPRTWTRIPRQDPAPAPSAAATAARVPSPSEDCVIAETYCNSPKSHP